MTTSMRSDLKHSKVLRVNVKILMFHHSSRLTEMSREPEFAHALQNILEAWIPEHMKELAQELTVCRNKAWAEEMRKSDERCGMGAYAKKQEVK